MRVQLRKIVAAIALMGGLACGSTADLIIGSQAATNVFVGPVCPTDGGGPPSGDASCDTSEDVVDAPEEAQPDEDAEAGVPTEGDAPPEVSCPNNGPCGPLRGALVHRYSFNGIGTIAIDSVGGAHGTIMGTRLNGDGTLILAGGSSDQYVDLPNGIIRSLHDATFEAWVKWNGPGTGGWQRFFDFGDNGNPEGVRGLTAASSLYLTPQAASASDGNVMFGAFKRPDQVGVDETRALSTHAFPTGAMHQVVLVVDDTHNVMALYLDGALERSTPFNDSLSTLNDINNWLGRSQYAVDPSYDGTFYEFRIFNAPLSANAVLTVYLGGPDAAFLN